MANRTTKWLAGSMTAVSIVAVLAGCGANNAANTAGNAAPGAGATAAETINETGSSLLYPLFNGQWISAYKSVDSNVSITAASTGSGAGIAQSISGAVQIGASDAYLPNAQMTAHPSMLNIPLAISAQQVMYNLPGMKADSHINLSGDILAQIYLDKIKYWDDAKIAAMNAGVQLPHKQFVPVRRSDGSGDTFLYTQFLSDTNTEWKGGPGFSTSVSWPSVPGEIGAKGNEGVVSELAQTPYSVGYVGISWLDRATGKGLGYAALQNQAGKFVVPTTDTIQAAANSMMTKVPDDERISLINAPGDNSYPIINFEYAIVNAQQSADMATALKKFLTWAVDPKGGNSSQYMQPVHFLPLPASVQPKSVAQINKIGG